MTTTCANHTGTAAAAYCRTCGKPLCEECKRDVRGVIYCEECIAARLQGTMPMVDPAVAVARPPRGLPNPTAAAFLGLIPGVGAFYNGQYQKGVIHVVMFIGIIAMTDRFDYFGFAIPLFIAYMIWDAYQTAKARITGEPVPDALGINNLFGLETSVPQSQDQAVGSSRPPVGAIVLIGLGILFLLGDTYGRVLENYWPILLIAIGLWKGMQRWQVSQ